MNGLEYLRLIIPATIIIFLAVKIYLMKRSLREISGKFREKLYADTNTLIDISSSDADLRKFASELNRELFALREMKLKYSRGNLELKQAVTNVSHDLRTPLTAISGYLDLLEREELSGNCSKYTAIIRERTDAMKTLTEELFNYSVITSDDNQPVFEDVSLNSALEENAAAFYALLSERGIEPKIAVPEQKVICRLDRKLLTRVLANVMSNAVKYSGGGLEITLSADGVIRYSNNAPALDEISVGRLFDRFYTVENGAGGTGIGLSIAKELTEQMGGKIGAEYENGRVVFTIDFRETLREKS